jgi:hypothetical protein
MRTGGLIGDVHYSTYSFRIDPRNATVTPERSTFTTRTLLKPTQEAPARLVAVAGRSRVCFGFMAHVKVLCAVILTLPGLILSSLIASGDPERYLLVLTAHVPGPLLVEF